jgi:hypothetical protein
LLPQSQTRGKSIKTKEEILARFKESIALKKRVMEEAEQRTVEYYEEFFRNNGHDVKLAK